MTVGSGPDRLELYYFGAGHCHSDIFVMIPALRVLLTGDAFGGKFLPALARPNGGNGVEYPNTLTKALPLTRDIDMIITGHGGVAKPQDLEVHRDFMRDFLESTRQAKKAGQTAAAAAKAVETAGTLRRLRGGARQGVWAHGVDVAGRACRVGVRRLPKPTCPV